jgi:hypothetical protein
MLRECQIAAEERNREPLKLFNRGCFLIERYWIVIEIHEEDMEEHKEYLNILEELDRNQGNSLSKYSSLKFEDFRYFYILFSGQTSSVHRDRPLTIIAIWLSSIIHYIGLRNEALMESKVNSKQALKYLRELSDILVSAIDLNKLVLECLVKMSQET